MVTLYTKSLTVFAIVLRMRYYAGYKFSYLKYIRHEKNDKDQTIKTILKFSTFIKNILIFIRKKFDLFYKLKKQHLKID